MSSTPTVKELKHLAKQDLRHRARVTRGEIGHRVFNRGKSPSHSLYESLPAGSIRLLTVATADDKTADCRLVTYSQRQAPRYDAISYCWGDDTTAVNIQCNGLDLSIRRTLLVFLAASLNRDHPSRPMWIDAICLNQRDDTEKAIQVPMMSEVYKCASRVVVWLGQPEEGLQDLVHFMHRAKKRIGKALLEERREGREPDSLLARDLFRNPWFHRIWTLQELLLAREVVILNNTEKYNTISWDDLERFERVAESLGWQDTTQQALLSRSSAALLYKVWYLKCARTQLRRTGFLSPFWLAELYSDRDCRLRVDRVWGLLGLLDPELVSRVRVKGIIDYSRAPEESWKSYLDFAITVHEFDVLDFFNMLEYDVSRVNSSHLPSWCIDFGAPTRYIQVGMSRLFDAGFEGSGYKEDILSTMDTSARALSVRGFCVGEARFNTTAYDPEKHVGDSVAFSVHTIHWLDECLELCRLAQIVETIEDEHSSQSGRRRPPKALCSALVAADKSHTNSLNPYTDVLQSLKRALQDSPEDAMSVGPPLGLYSEEMEDQLTRYWNNLRARCPNRKVFITQNNRIGLGPPDVQVGDKICVFIGTDVLWVLRPVNGADAASPNLARSKQCFRLIGDAYIVDLMHGEAFRERQSHRDEDFTLI